MPCCVGLVKDSAVGCEVSSFSPSTVAHTGGCSASLALVNGFNKFNSGCELHPPIALLPTQLTGIEITYVLNGGQKAGWVCLERK